MTDDAVRGCAGAARACPPWPEQRHPWADLDPLGRDRQPLPSLAPIQHVLMPCQIRLEAGDIPIGDGESYLDIAVRDHLVAEARRDER